MARRLLCDLVDGSIPVHVYSDVPFVPYKTLFEQEIGYTVLIEDTYYFMTFAQYWSDEDLARKEEKIRSYAPTHFTPDAIGRQILGLMTGKGTHLECMPMPESIRDGRNQMSTPGVTEEMYPVECH